MTDPSVLINEKKDETVDKDILYYKSLYLSGCHIEDREIKGVLTPAPMNANNLSYWASRVIQKKFKMNKVKLFKVASFFNVRTIFDLNQGGLEENPTAQRS